jgi:hypothetical protein
LTKRSRRSQPESKKSFKVFGEELVFVSPRSWEEKEMDWTLVLVLLVLVAFLLIAGLGVYRRNFRGADSGERSAPGEEGGSENVSGEN